MAKTNKPKETVRYRDAGDGQYITKKEADKNPDKSVRETEKKPPSKKK